eukprot:CAMPEP_0175376680 /NCGR_PEP_ID=MMETSP0095-20121207/24401_1 /TAXON_ID=311494 /ORGANISM="Alexandrium monilatum, Strain CCMP3105" /LENGTH=137 /DNA_ID=CAMNT_0016674973 /DNA_START=56 /DNA_END=467 /DNA_ORIENTATION=-
MHTSASQHHSASDAEDLPEDAIVELPQAQEPQRLPGLGADPDDEADHDKEPRPLFHEKVALDLGLPAERDHLALVLGVLLVVLRTTRCLPGMSSWRATPGADAGEMSRGTDGPVLQALVLANHALHHVDDGPDLPRR